MAIVTSVVTLTHNKLDYTRRCLGSLLRTAGDPWELIVVDNGSTDGTREWLETFKSEGAAHGVDVRLVCNATNVGCSTARNQGRAAAVGRNVVFVDNDVALRSRHWLDQLGRALAVDHTVGIVGPKLVYPFGPHDIQFAGGAVSPTGRVQFLGRGEHKNDPRFNKPREVQCFISACFMIRREALDATGGFDEAFNPVEYEDIDYCYRLRSRGYRILYEPSVEMYHFESVTTAGTKTLPNTYLIIRNGMRFKNRWRHMFAAENGPSDDETKWRQIETRRLSDVCELPVID